MIYDGWRIESVNNGQKRAKEHSGQIGGGGGDFGGGLGMSSKEKAKGKESNNVNGEAKSQQCLIVFLINEKIYMKIKTF